jgi:hypothetical protein
MKTFAIVLVCAVVLTFTMAAAPAHVDAIDWCEAAALAGWHHHGLNGACLVQIAFDWYEDRVMEQNARL